MKKIFFILLGIIGFLSSVYADSKNNPVITGMYQATGYSAAHQSRYAALIAAKVDAQRQLLEQIKGTKIDSETTVKNGMLQSDRVVSKVNGIVKNAKTIHESYDPSTGTATVTLAIGFNKVASEILSDKDLINKLKSDNISKSIEKIQKPKVIYDGLIIDVKKVNMEPAMINRVFSNKKIVYDPTKVPQAVIVERGLAAYTTDINRAKAILETYGSKKPYIAKAISLGEKSSDVNIAKEDAKKILTSDKENGFLSAAKVVFVLDN